LLIALDSEVAKKLLPYFGLGRANGRLDRYEQALEAYQKAVRLKPDFIEAQFSIGMMHAQLAGLSDRYSLHESLRLSGEATGWRDHGLRARAEIK
jgi:tetratricopeptide (TPR) repeat protein